MFQTTSLRIHNQSPTHISILSVSSIGSVVHGLLYRNLCFSCGVWLASSHNQVFYFHLQFLFNVLLFHSVTDISNKIVRNVSRNNAGNE